MLVLQDVAVTYQNVIPALRGVSLEVPDKVVVALLGTNGAGKTTLLRAISGLLPLHRGALVGGQILFEGERIDRLSPTRIVQLGIAQVLEGRRLFEDLTVDENLYAGAITVRNPAAVRRAYDRVMSLFPNLAERRTSRAGYLSGGEQQMLAIGRALMASPRLLLLDEPSLGLAPFMVQRIRSIIAEINAEGTAVLLVEQNAQMALSVAHYGYVLETGQVALAAPAARLLQEENIRQFYLGLREGERQLALGRLRQRRAQTAERRWQA
ncbi:ABC transporter ATP-binding protein [Thermogemmatispora sp.]|uniref:ABC transporter ATP-binding protein n=1 Tax=Thermogemmatispora sp. TaxID=1968838 RepID=UPI001D272A47|nr:ABC transporter ATP-binding protein [Thermogemmatispora sp.]MBX5448634.1 ABC transporter ATP-binding protein [Thermogemmatispora sp.]